MKNQDLSKQIKTLRIAKGFSQDYLATQTQLSLRTIQRIESGETEPRGDTLQRLAGSLGVEVSDLTTSFKPQAPVDSSYLTMLHLSALSFVIFPLLGALVPYMIWVSKGKQIAEAKGTVKRVLNFQITWCIIFLAYNVFMIGGAIFHFSNPLRVLPDLVLFFFIPAMYAYNILFICFNALREHKGKSLFYQPAIPLLH